MKIYLKEPELNEYWYEQKILSDPLSMEYNAGWDVSYKGYHYDTGCIDFPEENWSRNFDRRKDINRYFAYIVRKEDDKFIGYVNFQLNEKENKYECGVLIEPCYKRNGYGKEALIELCKVAFNTYNIDKLYDTFEENRTSCKIFREVGFKETSSFMGKKFDKNIKIIEICLTKKDFIENQII